MKNTLCLKTEVRTSCPKAYWGPQFPCLAFFLWGSLASGCNKGKCPVECGEILTICPPSNLPSICPKGFKGHMKESADQLQGSEGQPKGCEGQLEGTKKWWKPEQTKNENILFSVTCTQLYIALLVSWLVGQLVGSSLADCEEHATYGNQPRLSTKQITTIHNFGSTLKEFIHLASCWRNSSKALLYILTLPY